MHLNFLQSQFCIYIVYSLTLTASGNSIFSAYSVVLTVEFESEQYIGSELLGVIEVVVILSGWSSTTPISIMVTTTQHTTIGIRHRYKQCVICS